MNDVIEHHGVKGQRWGVRRHYKQLRNDAAKAAHQHDKELNEGLSGAYKIQRQAKRVSAYEKKLSDYKKSGSASSRKIARAEKKVAKGNKKIDRMIDKTQPHFDRANALTKRYNSNIAEAKKLKVTLIPTPKRDSAKQYMAAIAGGLLSSYVPYSQNIAARVINKAATKTEFDRAVSGKG